MTGWNIPADMRAKYIEACQKAADDDNCFSVFRRNPDLHVIWGHITPEDGREYFKEIVRKKRIPRWAMKEIVEFNNIGNPTTFECDGMVLSPTAFRYLYVISELTDLPQDSLPLSIIEIGGGYGGLAATAKKFLDVEDYTIVDLRETCLLQQRFFRECKVENITTLSNESFECHLKERYSLLISNYAFDEFMPDIQQRYMDIVKRCDHGYVTVNRDKDRLRDMLPCNGRRGYIEPGACSPEVLRW